MSNEKNRGGKITKLRQKEHVVAISHEDKILFPRDKITKGELVDYYRLVAEIMLPHLANRPISMYRLPNGLSGAAFYQKEVPEYFPEWIERAKVEKDKGKTGSNVVCNNTETIVYLANQACVTFHSWLSQTDRLHYPDKMIFDLDPPGDDFQASCFAAIKLRKILVDDLNMPAFVMTTGSRGLHVMIPLDKKADYEIVRQFGRMIIDIMVNKYPGRFTGKIRKEKRHGKLFIDIARNAYAQTAVAPYSVRALEGAPIATPLSWDELSNPDLNSQKYNIRNIARRLSRKPDPWKNYNRRKISIDSVIKLLNNLNPNQTTVKIK